MRRRAGPQGGAPSTASPAGQGRRRGRRARAHTAPRWPSSTSGWRGSTASTLRWHYARCVRQCRSRSRAPTPDALRERASGLGLPLFDKLEFERLLDWVETAGGRRRAATEDRRLRRPVRQKTELVCSLRLRDREFQGARPLSDVRGERSVGRPAAPVAGVDDSFAGLERNDARRRVRIVACYGRGDHDDQVPRLLVGRRRCGTNTFSSSCSDPLASDAPGGDRGRRHTHTEKGGGGGIRTLDPPNDG